MANRGPFVILSRVKKCTKILPHRATILFIQVFSFFVCFSDQRAVKILSVRFRPDRISSCDFSKSKQQQSFSSYYCLRSNALRTMCGKIRFILRAVSSPAPAAAVVYISTYPRRGARRVHFSWSLGPSPRLPTVVWPRIDAPPVDCASGVTQHGSTTAVSPPNSSIVLVLDNILNLRPSIRFEKYHFGPSLRILSQNLITAYRKKTVLI